MTNKQTTVALTVLVVILGIAICVVSFVKRTPVRSDIAGAAGNLLIEDYDPYVKQNGGVYTNLDIKTSADLQTTGTLTVSGTSAFTGAVSVGSSGTSKSKEIFTKTGVFLGANLAQAATTSQAYDIAVTGVVAGDTVFVSLATTTPTTNLGWRVLGANASSTSGFVTVILQNLTGGTQSIAAGGNAGGNSWGSTTMIHVLR